MLCLSSLVQFAPASDSLQWGTPNGASVASNGDLSAARQSNSKTAIRDEQVVAAVWAEADAAMAGDDVPDVHRLADNRSVIVKRSSRLDHPDPEHVDSTPLEQRFAQLPDDPFEEPESIDPFDELDAETPMDEAQDTLEEEFQRRDESEEYESDEYDLFDDPSPDESQQDTESDEDSAQLDLFLDPNADQDLTPTLDEEDTRLFEEMIRDDEDFLDRDSLRNSDPGEDSLQYGGEESIDLTLPQPTNGDLTEQQRRLLEEERAANKESCLEEIEKLRSDHLENIDLSIRVEGDAGEDFPFECALQDEQTEPRQWPQITYMWKAAGLCHKPLYFEQVHLERYGHSWGPYTQPIMSGVHFFGTLPILPYKMGIRTPNECVYTLGYYRPGSCAPYLVDAVPFTWRAAGYQTGVATGLSFLIP